MGYTTYMVGKKYYCATVVVLAIIMAAASGGVAQPPLPTDCIAELAPCLIPFNPNMAMCCTPLNDVVKNQRDCFCGYIISDPTGTFDLKTALELFTRCNITDVSSNLCSTAPASSPGGPTPVGSPPPPPSTNPKLAPPPKDKNGAQKTSWIGVSTLFSLLLICWSIMQ